MLVLDVGAVVVVVVAAVGVDVVRVSCAVIAGVLVVGSVGVGVIAVVVVVGAAILVDDVDGVVVVLVVVGSVWTGGCRRWYCSSR